MPDKVSAIAWISIRAKRLGLYCEESWADEELEELVAEIRDRCEQVLALINPQGDQDDD